MENIQINFGELIKEMEKNNLLIFFRKNVYGNSLGMFIEDDKHNIYQIEPYRHGAYLDRLIEDKIVVTFNQVDSNIIEEWEKERWEISDIEAFIKRHNLK